MRFEYHRLGKGEVEEQDVRSIFNTLNSRGIGARARCRSHMQINVTTINREDTAMRNY